MSISEQAGQPVEQKQLANIPRLVSAYYTGRPDPEVKGQRVSFGTSGHRGSSLSNSFNESHIVAVTQAICDYRRERNIDGPLFLGMDTHALSEPAFNTAVEVLAGNEIDTLIDADGGYTPTPALSHAILKHNRDQDALADGVVITPSHNPPEDGGFKYNPPHGGPADSDVTGWIENRANDLLARGLKGCRRIPFARALKAPTTHSHDYLNSYVGDLGAVLDMDAIHGAGLHMCADALGGAGLAYWGPIGERYGLNLEVANADYKPTFRFMTLDWDGKIRMDCSSRYAMARLIRFKDEYDLAFGCDTDHDRHGIVTPSAGLLNPNHYLAVAVSYLFRHRKQWSADIGVGKTLVSSTMLDYVTASLGRPLFEVPVGFKWFVDGLGNGTLGFGGEESAGASFLRMDGGTWTTDKDGMLLGLLAAEITAHTGKDPGELYRDLTAEFGEPIYERIDAPANGEQKAILGRLSPESVTASELAGEKIEHVLTAAPGNGAPIGGLKVTTAGGWFAARPSGTEDVYKIYAESFRGDAHLRRVQEEARALIAGVFAKAGQ